MMFAGAAMAILYDHFRVVLSALASVLCRAVHFVGPKARARPAWFTEWTRIIVYFLSPCLSAVTVGMPFSRRRGGPLMLATPYLPSATPVQLTLLHAGDQNA